MVYGKWVYGIFFYLFDVYVSLFFGFYMYSARWFQMLVPHILHVVM